MYPLPSLLVFSQPIISKAKPQLLKTHFLPLMEKLKKKAATVLLDEESMKAEGRGEMSEAELLILDEFTILVRDLYAFYPLLIRFVDYNRYSCWLVLWSNVSKLDYTVFSLPVTPCPPSTSIPEAFYLPFDLTSHGRVGARRCSLSTAGGYIGLC